MVTLEVRAHRQCLLGEDAQAGHRRDEHCCESFHENPLVRLSGQAGRGRPGAGIEVVAFVPPLLSPGLGDDFASGLEPYASPSLSQSWKPAGLVTLDRSPEPGT